jgi:hypothetical protein
LSALECRDGRGKITESLLAQGEQMSRIDRLRMSFEDACDDDDSLGGFSFVQEPECLDQITLGAGI